MVLRKTGNPPVPPAARSGSLRRPFIYPHRSVRSIRLTPGRIFLAAVTAIVLTVLVATQHGWLVTEHNQLTRGMVELAGVPVTGVEMAPLFPGLQSAPAVVVSSSRLDGNPFQLLIMFAVGMLVLLQVHRRVPLARGFVLFLMILLLVATAIVVFHPTSQFGSVEFTQIWLRGEVLVWLLLPLFSAAMFVLIHPLFGAAWALVTQLYGFLWSAVRLAFSICLIHYSGILFVPIAWFALGLLADMVYLVVSYSIAVEWASRRAWGRRDK
jgi:hypothetical protein